MIIHPAQDQEHAEDFQMLPQHQQAIQLEQLAEIEDPMPV